MIPVKTVTAFVIKRSEWWRGEGHHGSRLLRSRDNKRCCVGIYARALGQSDKSLCDVPWPDHPEHSLNYVWTLSDNDEAAWLLHVEGLATANDDMFISEEARELKVAAIFAEHGVTVTFED